MLWQFILAVVWAVDISHFYLAKTELQKCSRRLPLWRTASDYHSDSNWHHLMGPGEQLRW